MSITIAIVHGLAHKLGQKVFTEILTTVCAINER